MRENEGIDTRVSWDAARFANEANWDDRAVIHEPVYGVEAFQDPAYRSVVIRDDLPVLETHSGPLEGQRILHLQCHIGTDTVSLARSGAQVTGLDFSEKSLEAAQRTADRAGAVVDWVQSDVLEARSAVSGTFDVVYTSIGTICWFDDLSRWAQQIEALLEPGGVFFIRDGHPMLNSVDEKDAEPILRCRYFANGQAQMWEDPSTYAGPGTVEHPRTYEFPHPISEILGALLAAGLVLERFDEGKTLPWQGSPSMEQVGEGTWAWPERLRDVIPCTFTVVARKPRGASAAQ
jgi:2-polyprenyl-3-methyl-5-hydroxy-6-metoxy-1,4-benzoquinol methylase